jgi:hypothetical protein
MSKEFFRVIFDEEGDDGAGQWKAIFTRTSIDDWYREKRLPTRQRGLGYGDPSRDFNNAVIAGDGIKSAMQMGDSIAEALSLSEIEHRIRNPKQNESISCTELERGLEALRKKMGPGRRPGDAGGSIIKPAISNRFLSNDNQ